VIYFLDTNMVSELARASPDAAVPRQVDAHAGDMALAAVTWYELYYGAGRMPRGRRRRWLEAFLAEVVAPVFPVVAYETRAAEWHAKERARCAKAGFTPALADAMIAATAAAHGLILVTRNTNDFAPFDGLPVENWFE